MIVKAFGKYILKNNSYFIRINSKRKFRFKKIFGKKLRIEENLDLFMHKVTLKGKTFYTVSEATSGCRVAKLHKNPKKAIDKAKSIIEKYGESSIMNRANRQIKSSSLSPRYGFIVNPTRQKRCGNLRK